MMALQVGPCDNGTRTLNGGVFRSLLGTNGSLFWEHRRRFRQGQS
jgi:hypothetical protein